MVRGQELRQVAPRGHPHQARRQGVPPERGHRGRRDRARRQQVQGHRLHGAAGHGHRQGRQGHRDAEDRQPQDGGQGRDALPRRPVVHRERGLHRRPGGAQGRDGRAARGREHRHAARAPRRLPPRDEEGAHHGDEVRRQGHPRALLGPPRRQRDEPRRDLPRGARSAPHAPRRHRVRHRRGPHQVRHHRRQGLGLQGRGAPAPQPPPADSQEPEDDMLSPKRTKYRKAQKGNNRGTAHRGSDVSFGDFAHAGGRAGPRHVAPDRGRAHGHHPPREARRQALDPRLPGPPGDQEAARSPHGWRQGRRRRVGGRSPARAA